MRKAAAPLTLVLMLLAPSFLSVAKPASAAEAITENSWATKAPMNVARSSLGVAVVGGRIYAIGGLTASGNEPNTIGTDYDAKGWIVNTNEEYDPATDKWAFKTPMPTPRYSPATAVYNNKIYCMGGISHVRVPSFNQTAVNEVYDPATDTWETKAQMPIASGGQANVLGGRIYVIGPVLTSGTLIEIYDPATDSWNLGTPIPPLPNVPLGLASAVLDNKLYVMSGFYDRAGDRYESVTEVYDPLTDEWTAAASVPLIHWIVGATATTGVMAPKRIYVFGINETLLAKPELARFVQIYDPQHDVWTAGSEAPTNRIDFGIAVVNDTLYAIGGYTNHYPVPFSDSNRYVELSALNEQYLPAGYGTPDPSYDTTPPKVTIASPENKTYHATNLTLDFSVNEPITWASYRLDNQTEAATPGNTTITGLSSGSHTLTLHASDYAGNQAAQTVYFTIAEETEPETFPTVPVTIGIAMVAVIIVAAGLLLYNRKRRKKVNVNN